jgi:hypothetical protein
MTMKIRSKFTNPKDFILQNAPKRKHYKPPIPGAT